MNDKRTLTPAQEKVRKHMVSPFLMRLFLFAKIPLGWLSGMKVVELDTAHAVTTIKYKWLNQNPFKSMYFASQSMAAELSTGALALLAMEGTNPKIKAIITGNNAEFVKKAKERIYFHCEMGQEIFDATDTAKTSEEPIVIKVRTEGKTKNGTLVSVFHFNWIFSK
ncbi:MAG: DUF4442 domain-containing protein [Reichenbachiella sp.]